MKSKDVFQTVNDNPVVQEEVKTFFAKVRDMGALTSYSDLHPVLIAVVAATIVETSGPEELTNRIIDEMREVYG